MITTIQSLNQSKDLSMGQTIKHHATDDSLHYDTAVYDTATSWFVRLRAEDITPSEQDHFFDWLFMSASHQTAFEEILTLWEKTAVIKVMGLAKIN